MQAIKTISTLRKYLDKARKQNKTIGFVPTMGYFHEGHLSLMRKARKENDLVVVSIFVNPTQFGPKEDYKKYPRNKKHDLLLARKEKIDTIFYPSEKEMYPARSLTVVEVKKLSNVLCGKVRPGHFEGVATIVAKLLNIVQPDTFYLGQKDAQQAILLKRMVDDLNFSTKIKILPIVREEGGLAMSSRNKYLSNTERVKATTLYRSLTNAKQKILKNKVRQASIIRTNIKRELKSNKISNVDYIACVNANTLKPLKKLKGPILIALAVRIGSTRLIDNIVIKV